MMKQIANIIWRRLGSRTRTSFGCFHFVLLIYMLSFLITNVQTEDELSHNIIEDDGRNITAFTLYKNIYSKSNSAVQNNRINFTNLTANPLASVSSTKVPLNRLESSNIQHKLLKSTGKDEFSQGQSAPLDMTYFLQTTDESNSIISQSTSKPTNVNTDTSLELKANFESSLTDLILTISHSTTPQSELIDEDINIPSESDFPVLDTNELQLEVTKKPRISLSSVASNNDTTGYSISPSLLVNAISDFQTLIEKTTQFEDSTSKDFLSESYSLGSSHLPISSTETSSEHFQSDSSSPTAQIFEQSSATLNNSDNLESSLSPISSTNFVNNVDKINASDVLGFSISRTTVTSVSQNSDKILKSETYLSVSVTTELNLIKDTSSSEPVTENMIASTSANVEIPAFSESTVQVSESITTTPAFEVTEFQSTESSSGINTEILTSNTPYYTSEVQSSADSTTDNSGTVTIEATTEVTTEATTQCIEDFENLGVELEIIDVTEESIEISVILNSTCSDIYPYNISWLNLGTNQSNSIVSSETILKISSLQSCSEYNISVEILDTDGIIENGKRPTGNIIAGTYSKVTLPPEFVFDETNKRSSLLQFSVQYEGPACAPKNCTVNCTVIDPFQRPGLTNGSGFSTEFDNGHVTVTVTDLSPFTNYSCVAYATNDIGDSDNSENVIITTLEDVPPAPEIIKISTMNGDVNIEWTIDDVPGRLKIFVVYALYIQCDATKCSHNTTDFRFEVDPDKRSYSTNQLEHYSLYNIMVEAYTNAGGSNASFPWDYRTEPAESESVEDLSITFYEDDLYHYWNAILTWNLPSNTNGILESFDIDIEDIHESLNYSYDNCCKHFLNHLKPVHDYTIKVVANVEGFNGSPNSSLTSKTFKSPAGIPSISSSSSGSYFRADPYATSAATQTQITFYHALFSEEDGEINWYEIIVAQDGNQEESKNGLYENFESLPTFPSWNETFLAGPYRASPACWKPFINGNVATFLLGDQDCSTQDTDCNRPLIPDTNYVVKIRAFTGYCVSDDCKGGYQDSDTIHFTTGSEIAVGMIVGIMFAIILLGFLAILFIMYRKGTLVWPPKLFKGAKPAVRPQPILLKKFPTYCAQLLDTPNRLKNEFQLLATLSVDLVAVNTIRNGEQPENRRKNRYCNILPYDATRVILDLVDGDPTSHYINASFITGYSDDIEYIACQGPLEDTCEDFWRMVYQHEVRVIAMVTNLVEQNKLKCHQYYPNLQENLVFGDMTIRCTTEINFLIHTARTLVLIKGDRKRTISHLHFREWPDFGVPQSTDFMLQFCQTMRHHAMAAEIGLVLVHCSAGVGRTGTLIAIDILLQHISENKKVDIFGTVFKLRKQRINMVQTEGQYTYIYRCIKEAVQDPTIVSQGTTSNNSLEPIYENVGTTLNSLPYEYEKLPKWRRA